LNRDQLLELERIRFLANVVDSLLKVDELEHYRKHFEYSYIQGTTFIEGVTLTLQQVVDLLEHGIVPKGKELREINAVQNYRQVARYREEYKGKVDIVFIRHLHSLIMNNILVDAAGEFRRIDDIGIMGLEARLCPALLIEMELERIVDEYYQAIEEDDGHPFEFAVQFNIVLLSDPMPSAIP